MRPAITKDDGDGGARLGDGLAEHHEDAGTERGADADHGQLPHAERAAQAAAFTLAALGDQALDRLAPHQPRAEAAGVRVSDLFAVRGGAPVVEHAAGSFIAAGQVAARAREPQAEARPAPDRGTAEQAVAATPRTAHDPKGYDASQL